MLTFPWGPGAMGAWVALGCGLQGLVPDIPLPLLLLSCSLVVLEYEVIRLLHYVVGGAGQVADIEVHLAGAAVHSYTPTHTCTTYTTRTSTSNAHTHTCTHTSSLRVEALRALGLGRESHLEGILGGCG
ncbi:hypothetical protein B484DRAFT_166006, partial [Ochromonadaceae sp. CCMP2298]